MKNSFSIFEIILTLVISSFIYVATMNYLKDITSLNQENLEYQIKQLDLNSTKIFLQKNNKNLDSNIHFENQTVYFKDSILLPNVENFNLTQKDKYYEINLSFQNQNITWVILK